MKNRLLSLDVFRGLTIFFMVVVNTPGSWSYVYFPLLHAKWHGCSPTDLVFPFFLFIVGVSMSIAYSKFNENEKDKWIKKAVWRGTKIVIVGLLLNWFPFYTKSLDVLRVFGVLQRIGLAFIFGAIVVAFVKEKYLWYVLGLILVAYWGIFQVLGNGDYTVEGNIVRSIDLYLFGSNHMYKGFGVPFDPEGLLSTMPSVGTVILGFIIGNIFISKQDTIAKLTKYLTIGVLCILLGLLWQWVGFPLNKPLWTSSYVLYAGGLAMMLFTLIVYVVDIKGYQSWAYVFKVFGQNPLISFVLSGIFVKIMLLIKIGDQNLYNWLYTSIYQFLFGDYLGSFLFALVYTFFIWMFAWYLFKRKIIVKL